MRNLSRWAKFHPLSARLVIIVSHLLLTCLAFFLAKIFTMTGVYVSPVWMFLLVIIFIFCCVSYPQNFKGTYVKRKLLDFSVAFCGFWMICCLVYQLDHPAIRYTSVNAALVSEDPVYKNPEAGKLLDAYNKGEKKSFSRKEKKLLKKEFTYQVKQYALAKFMGNDDKATQVGLIILTIIIAAGLFYLLMALACDLSCNGQEGAATIVFFGGLAAIIFGVVMAIRAIKKSARKKAGTDIPEE